MTHQRRIYAIFGVPPEVQAYSMARYSRSAQSMLENIRYLSQQRAEQFLNTFYFQYGHRSIADLAHLAMALENISILAAMRVVDEQLWDGQERSTRYQDFRNSGFYTPDLGEKEEQLFRRAAENLFTAYEKLAQDLLARLKDSVPCPADMETSAYERALRARALDVARYLLPLATHTSVGQVTSARVLERQIARLLSDPYPEVRSIGEDMRLACQRPAEAPLLPADSELREVRAAPTLVKYAHESFYLTESRRRLEAAARELLGGLGEPDRSRTVELAMEESPLDEAVASILYAHDPRGHSYRQIQQVVREMHPSSKREVLSLSVAHRGQHDELLRVHQTGYALKFDILIDLGSFRDLHRHRRCVQIIQPLTWEHGHDPVHEVFSAGLGPKIAQEALSDGLGEVYQGALAQAHDAAFRLPESASQARDYLLPMAYRCRALFKMDVAQAVYIAELRTAPAGHFSYRRVAWRIWQALAEFVPDLAASISPRVIDPEAPFDLLQR